jgi:hypothetical protein
MSLFICEENQLSILFWLEWIILYRYVKAIFNKVGRWTNLYHRSGSWELHADMMNAADEYKSPAALSAVECELISVNNENVWFNMIIMIDMSNEKVLTNTRNMRAELLVDPQCRNWQSQLESISSSSLEFRWSSRPWAFSESLIGPLRVLHSYYTSNGFTCCCSIFSSLF